MAPLPLIDELLHTPTVIRSSQLLHRLQTRDLPPEAFVGSIIGLVILSSLAIVGVILLLAKTWTFMATRLGRRLTPPPPQDMNMTEIKPGDWARQNSNVLWSTYIGDDDLRAQFARPSRISRLFSIGSLASDYGRCPLDRRGSNTSADNDSHRLIDAKKVNEGVGVGVGIEAGDIRNRVKFEHEASPPRKLSIMQAKAKAKKPYRLHRHTKSLEEMAGFSKSLKLMADRKRSMPAQYYKKLSEEE